MKTTIARQELMAALLFTSTDETRYIINGVCIQGQPGRSPLVVATDGRRLCAIETVADQEHECEEEFSIVLRPDYAKLIAQLSKCCGGKDGSWLTIQFEPDAKAIGVTFVNTGARFTSDTGALVEGTFPDWRKCVPPKKQKREPVTDLAIDASFIGDLAKACKLLGKEDSHVQMNLVGKEQQVEVSLRGVGGFYGLLMQVKLDTELEYQPEFASIVSALPKPPEEVEPDAEEAEADAETEPKGKGKGK